MLRNDTQQRPTAFIGRETEYRDFWGSIRIVKIDYCGGQHGTEKQTWT